MNDLDGAVSNVLRTQKASGKPLAVVLAGHNGSGKSTLWYKRLASRLQIPLVNADRMMLSILPEVAAQSPLPDWARALRDTNVSWMAVAQKGVEAFVAQAMARKVPFAMETVFSHWREQPNGRIESKIDLIRQMQAAGYFVVLFFVGLTHEHLSILRVSTRVEQGGHAVDAARLVERFHRTQKAIGAAASVADATVMFDNSRTTKEAFTVCRVQLQDQVLFDMRDGPGEPPPPAILAWLDRVSPKAHAPAAGSVGAA